MKDMTTNRDRLLERDTLPASSLHISLCLAFSHPFDTLQVK